MPAARKPKAQIKHFRKISINGVHINHKHGTSAKDTNVPWLRLEKRVRIDKTHEHLITSNQQIRGRNHLATMGKVSKITHWIYKGE